ncbi:MAG: ABC transporter ATP-binding protein [Clostridiales bacterium]|uniref:ABC transporter ATP-binding protein n=1 Tax=Clostridium sp. N3C TaxID=1776758 RepID=UPI00092DEEC0|nr:ABC transporter ATP-binding protein [Clostridium sp. N3C]NLZ47767.1 ABC transporter ATP-binding protein [Clostridiales bacterium]SCN25421.1 ABC transporter ATP-binding protein YtrB [Clostridium sp. N3C]
MIVLKDAVKCYKDFNLNISMEIPKGRISGLVGKNGAGKSTTIKLILGLVKPNSGSVTVLGTESSKLTSKEKEQIGVSLSDASFSSQLTLSDVEKILIKMYPKFDKEYFQKLSQGLNLPKDKIIREFSTGMKAKLRVLVAITHKAKLLILDEPTAGLDVEARNEILDILRKYMEEDEERTILITSHISSDLEGLCDDIYLIHDGKIMLHEETDVILDRYGLLKVNEEQYASLDKNYILKSQKEPYGYACFTNEKQYYQENYKDIIIEKGGIDELILMMTGGYR